MLYILVLLYIFNGQLILEKPGFETLDKCVTAGQKRIADLQAHPDFEGGLYAECVQLPGQKG